MRELSAKRIDDGGKGIELPSQVNLSDGLIVPTSVRKHVAIA
jgi:hypothetical protein